MDIPISNCLNSGIRSIYVLTQFNSMSRIATSTRATSSIIYPELCRDPGRSTDPEGSHWYQGTAHAVRQNLRYLERPVDYYIILSGDQLYRMDYRHVLRQHSRLQSDITVGTTCEPRGRGWLGIMHTDEKRKIIEFVENRKIRKCWTPAVPSDLLRSIGQPHDADLYQASMGIYVFNRGSPQGMPGQ